MSGPGGKRCAVGVRARVCACLRVCACTRGRATRTRAVRIGGRALTSARAWRWRPAASRARSSSRPCTGAVCQPAVLILGATSRPCPAKRSQVEPKARFEPSVRAEHTAVRAYMTDDGSDGSASADAARAAEVRPVGAETLLAARRVGGATLGACREL
eukprot:scaffold114849_cov75-Phaeocystis_antarctica.AAC.1